MGEGFYANTTKEFPIAKNVEVANGVITEIGKNGVSNAEVPRFVIMAMPRRSVWNALTLESEEEEYVSIGIKEPLAGSVLNSVSEEGDFVMTMGK